MSIVGRANPKGNIFAAMNTFSEKKTKDLARGFTLSKKGSKFAVSMPKLKQGDTESQLNSNKKEGHHHHHEEKEVCLGPFRDFVFFDEKSELRCGTRKVRIFIDPPPQRWAKDDIICVCSLSQRGEKFGQFIDLHCVFEKNYLHVYENKDRTGYVGSYYQLTVKTECFKDEAAHNRFGIRFIKNSICEELLTKDLNLFQKLKTELIKCTIQTDYYTKFKVLDKQGEGKFGIVFRVMNAETEKIYAAKIFEKNSKSYLLKECVLQELSVMRKVKDHPNLANQYEVHETKSQIIFITDFLAGGELFDVIKHKSSFSLKEAAHIMKHCLEGLSHMQTLKVVHRDIKPENILFRYRNRSILDNEIVICDFGLACSSNDDGKPLFLRLCGSPGYIAPELLLTKASDNFILYPKTDMFSLGVIFYILLTGTSPWNSSLKATIMEQNRDCRIDWENRFVRNIDPNSRLLLQSMVTKEPEMRNNAIKANEFFNSFENNEFTNMSLGTSFVIFDTKPMVQKNNSKKKDENVTMTSSQNNIEFNKKGSNKNFNSRFNTDVTQKKEEVKDVDEIVNRQNVCNIPKENIRLKYGYRYKKNVEFKDKLTTSFYKNKQLFIEMFGDNVSLFKSDKKTQYRKTSPKNPRQMNKVRFSSNYNLHQRNKSSCSNYSENMIPRLKFDTSKSRSHSPKNKNRSPKSKNFSPKSKKVRVRPRHSREGLLINLEYHQYIENNKLLSKK